MGDVPIFLARRHKTVIETNAQRIVAISGFPPTDHCEVLPWPSEAKDFNARMLTPPMVCCNGGFEQRDCRWPRCPLALREPRKSCGSQH